MPLMIRYLDLAPCPVGGGCKFAHVGIGLERGTPFGYIMDAI
jgi:hypothetical protein